MARKLILTATAIAASVFASASEFGDISVECDGLDKAGVQRCLDIIARHQFGPEHTMRPLSLADRTAINAVLHHDAKAVLVVLPDGSVLLGHDDGDRIVGLPCEASPCPEHWSGH
jgi:hypothetical protein